MKETIISRIKKKRQILFNRDDEIMIELSMIINDMPKKAVVSWAIEMAEESLKVLEDKYPHDDRPKRAIELTKLWAKGELKMPVVKGSILECHAIGQACSTMHTIRHAIGYPMYDLTALIRENKTDEYDLLISQRVVHYEERLRYWKDYYENK